MVQLVQPSPPSILIPSVSSHDLTRTLQGSETNHFITKREFDLWSREHPSVRPSVTPSTGDQGANSLISAANAKPSDVKGKGTGYRAPQHPVSHLLQSIPPRAPSRSSRSNILSYSLHLATATRLNTYSAPNGSRSVLHRAEAADFIDQLSEQWLEAEQRAAGLWKVSVNLLKSNRREGQLPSSLERRVALASFVESLLSNPISTAQSSTKRLEKKDLKDSAQVESLKALSVLTSPDTTRLYHSIAPSTAPSKKTTSVAQSLIDMKFGGSKDGEGVTPLSERKASDGPNRLATDRTRETVFGSEFAREDPAAPLSSSSGIVRAGQLTATPHMDYRIVRGQAMRSRAREIFSTSILPTASTTWCRLHRVSSCQVCTQGLSGLLTDEKGANSLLSGIRRAGRHNVPGQGLDSTLCGTFEKKTLAELVPEFLVFSATMLKHLRERALQFETEAEESEYTIEPTEKGLDSDIDATAAWYSLLHSMLIQACLEGHLVDGWTGTMGIEVLLGCGCGVWEGRGWSARVAHSTSTVSNAAKSVDGRDQAEIDEDSESEDEEDQIEREKEREKASLIEAAQALFGSRDVAQADFERNMRDRIQEFLNVPEDATLETHLLQLNAKYPLSAFEDDIVDFLESTTKLLGKPALAKYENPKVVPGQLSVGEPDPYALTRYFSRYTHTEIEPNTGPHRAWEEASKVDTIKRRKVD